MCIVEIGDEVTSKRGLIPRKVGIVTNIDDTGITVSLDYTRTVGLEIHEDDGYASIKDELE